MSHLWSCYKDSLSLDIHTTTAAGMFSIPYADVTEEQRRIAKILNHGVLYGMDNGKINQAIIQYTLIQDKTKELENLLNCQAELVKALTTEEYAEYIQALIRED